MPIISEIGRRSPRTRLLIAGIYATLFLGATTMIYPFLLMLAGTSKSAMDTPEAEVIPRFVTSEEELYRKHMEGFFNESLQLAQMSYQSNISSFRTMDMPSLNASKALLRQWEEFLAKSELPFYFYSPSYLSVPRSRNSSPANLRGFVAYLQGKYGANIDGLNAALNTAYPDWTRVSLWSPVYIQRRQAVQLEPLYAELRAFMQTLPAAQNFYISVEGFYKTSFLMAQHGRDISGYNSAYGTNYKSWDEVHLPRRAPVEGRARADWEAFVRDILNILWIEVDTEALPAYQEYIKIRHGGSIEALNKLYGTTFADFTEIDFTLANYNNPAALAELESYLKGWRLPDSEVEHRLPLEALRIRSIDFMFQDFLRGNFATIDELNTACKTSFTDWAQVLPPQQEWHYRDFLTRKTTLRVEFLTRNFRAVFSHLVLNGRGLYNTVVYCSLAILAALIVNPMAAYALSRYKLRSTYKILLFLMLTMAFPPMVTKIPVFLLLREFNFLNTFWALILPGLANGYSIFLLKGFFDSLPQELYEAAEIDGAGELRIFWQITMSLSKPILAVIALGAFNAAYSNFMMALLICQDQKMWTIMPWLYQLQMNSGQGVVFASLVLAAIPTFIVFVCCQNVIMRGIVVPVEK